MGPEITAEMIAASDASESTPSDTPLMKLPPRTPPSAGDREALWRVLEMAERLIQDQGSIRSRIRWQIMEMVVAPIFVGALALTFDLLGTVEYYPIGFAIVTLWGAFMLMRLFTLRGATGERQKNERLAGKAVEFVREYAALTRADRSPAEEAELQLRLEQIGIEPLDRPM